MATTYNPRIVTNGMVLCLDAANTQSYPGSGTTWTDLSGNGNHVSLQNGMAYNSNNKGYFTLDGVDDQAVVTTPNNLDLGSGNLTISYWVYHNSLSNLPTAVDMRSIGDSAGYADYIETAKYRVWLGFNAYTSNETLVTNKWYNMTITRVSGTASVYINNNLDGTFSMSNNFSSNNLKIGVNDGGNRVNGRFNLLLVYKNKGLSASEVAQNFNATRGRFGV